MDKKMLNTPGTDIIANAWSVSESITTPDIMESFFNGPFAKKVDVDENMDDSDISRFISAGKEALKTQAVDTPSVEVVGPPNEVCGTRFLTPLQVAKAPLPKVVIKQEPVDYSEEAQVPQTADIIEDIIQNESNDAVNQHAMSQNHFFASLTSMSQQSQNMPATAVNAISSTSNPSYNTLNPSDIGSQSYYANTTLKVESEDNSNSYMFASSSHSVSPSPSSTTGSFSDYEGASDSYLNNTSSRKNRILKFNTDIKKSRLTSRQKERMMKEQVDYFIRDNQFCKSEIQRMEREITACKKLIQEAFAQKTQMHS